jgi:hypothetical protein
MKVMAGSASNFDFAPWDWCLTDADDFIQAIQVPGGVLLSPIEITAAPLVDKTLQERFYKAKPRYRVRRGPATFDSVRMTSTIDYDRAIYAYPTALVAPPLILQTRAEKTGVCKNNLGSLYAEQLWDETVNGVTCELPYQCDDAFLANSTSLLSCRTSAAPRTFFGQTPLVLDGQEQFYEFLQRSASDCACVSHLHLDTAAARAFTCLHPAVDLNPQEAAPDAAARTFDRLIS